jgi:hypothetical protein
MYSLLLCGSGLVTTVWQHNTSSGAPIASMGMCSGTVALRDRYADRLIDPSVSEANGPSVNEVNGPSVSVTNGLSESEANGPIKDKTP